MNPTDEPCYRVKEDGLIKGTTARFKVWPLYAMYRSDSSRIKNTWTSTPQKPNQRPCLWQLSKLSNLPDVEYWVSHSVAQFKTRKAAVTEANRLAKENKTLALLRGNSREA
jgi:hypothetical protein